MKTTITKKPYTGLDRHTVWTKDFKTIYNKKTDRGYAIDGVRVEGVYWGTLAPRKGGANKGSQDARDYHWRRWTDSYIDDISQPEKLRDYSDWPLQDIQIANNAGSHHVRSCKYKNKYFL